MDDPKSVVPVGAVGAGVIPALTDAFANDVISVAELEDRLEKVYRATTAAEAEALVVGLQRAPAPADRAPGDSIALRDPSLERDSQRLNSILSSQSRRGVWTVPRRLDVFALFSDTVIDLTHASLPQDIVELHVRVIFASVRIVVPPGMRVVNRVGAFAANVESEPALDLAPMIPGSPVIRVSGSATFANLEIVSGDRTL
jgi:hypothetical protein